MGVKKTVEGSINLSMRLHLIMMNRLIKIRAFLQWLVLRVFGIRSENERCNDFISCMTLEGDMNGLCLHTVPECNRILMFAPPKGGLGAEIRMAISKSNWLL